MVLSPRQEKEELVKDRKFRIEGTGNIDDQYRFCIEVRPISNDSNDEDDPHSNGGKNLGISSFRSCMSIVKKSTGANL